MAQIPDDQPVGGGWKELDQTPTMSESAAGPMQSAKKAAKVPKAPKDAKTVKLGKFEVPVRALAAGGALLAVLVFIVQNRDEAETNFLFIHGTQPLWFVIVISVLLGALLGQAVGMLRHRQKKT